jgi:hypothetical protein
VKGAKGKSRGTAVQTVHYRAITVQSPCMAFRA